MTTVSWTVGAGAGTALGGLGLLVLRRPSHLLLDVLLCFTAGVMLAAAAFRRSPSPSGSRTFRRASRPPPPSSAPAPTAAALAAFTGAVEPPAAFAALAAFWDVDLRGDYVVPRSPVREATAPAAGVYPAMLGPSEGGST